MFEEPINAAQVNKRAEFQFEQTKHLEITHELAACFCLRYFNSHFKSSFASTFSIRAHLFLSVTHLRLVHGAK